MKRLSIFLLSIGLAFMGGRYYQQRPATGTLPPLIQLPPMFAPAATPMPTPQAPRQPQRAPYRSPLERGPYQQ